ncbi:IE-0 [Lymantria xylina nucleopolyhedrovirus]|uniref:IE-0 n=1 Tax=Lymantria xylina multiple nucleopolyhedrovirus TaxID=2847840 RepID=D4N255_9ABAC|nr:IE-0 [Lymantria xylina nucleopolyhedrovirus]ADD73727.1 IE-0 [Lymantria xylina nucleopolyhedrovirus]
MDESSSSAQILVALMENAQPDPTAGQPVAQVILDNFCLSGMYSPDVLRNPRAQQTIKTTVFQWIDEQHRKMYDCPIESPLRFEDDAHLSADRCWHHLIGKLERVISVLRIMRAAPRFEHNIFIFLPYCKRLRALVELFRHDYCCQSTVAGCARALDETIADARRYLLVVKSMSERAAVMLVFSDALRVYQCDICHDSSAEEQFLKPNVCCGYRVCNACYAKLWEFCTGAYPVCPICKTSFKSSSSKKRLQKADDLAAL